MNRHFTWTPIRSCTASMSEANLQAIFNDWQASCGERRIAGAPHWLLNCKGPNRRATFRAQNYTTYSFTPDVLWDSTDCYVLELKRSAKYEPLALAEVLHHAWQLSDPAILGREVSKPPIPVMVTSSTDTAWLRGALNYLFAHGLTEDALRYLEVTFLRTEDGHDYLWFEEPFAKRTLSESIPDCIPDSWRLRTVTCYQITESKSWVLSNAKLSDRRASVPERFVFVSTVVDSNDSLVYVYDGVGTDGASYLVQAVSKPESALNGAPACPFS